MRRGFTVKFDKRLASMREKMAQRSSDFKSLIYLFIYNLIYI